MEQLMTETPNAPAVKSRTASARDKAEETNAAARAILEQEVQAREAKSARLKKLRLAAEARAAAEPKPAAKVNKRPRAKTTAGGSRSA